VSERTLFDRLAESVGTMAHLPNNGASYHTGEQIITHLNRVLGPASWSFHILDQGMEEDSDECWVFAQITAIIDGQTVVKQDYGSQAVKRSRSTGKYLSKGEDRKSAATDALKRCARLLGVGLDAWANERAPSWRPEQDAEAPTPAAPKAIVPEKKVAAAAMVTGAAPQPVKTRHELIQDIERGTKAARDLGIVMTDVDVTKLDYDQLTKAVVDLAALVRDAKSQKRAS
jgi:hypothetical protein